MEHTCAERSHKKYQLCKFHQQIYSMFDFFHAFQGRLLWSLFKLKPNTGELPATQQLLSCTSLKQPSPSDGHACLVYTHSLNTWFSPWGRKHATPLMQPLCWLWTLEDHGHHVLIAPGQLHGKQEWFHCLHLRLKNSHSQNHSLCWNLCRISSL